MCRWDEITARQRAPTGTRCIVMMPGGLWHGSAMTFFVAWRTLHGAALAVERQLGWNRPSLADSGTLWMLRSLAWYAVVQAAVLIAWILFHSETLSEPALCFPESRPVGSILPTGMPGSGWCGVLYQCW